MADAKRAFDLLKRIGFTRVSGTPAELQAAQLLQDELKNMGLQGALEPFAVEGERVIKATFEVLEPYHKRYEVTGYEGAKKVTDFEAEFIYVGEMTELNFKKAKGKIALVNGRMTMETYELLTKAGVAGFVTMSGMLTDEEEKTDLETRRMRPAMEQYGLVPAFNIRIKNAMELVQQEAKKVRVTLQTEPLKWQSQNVVVTLTGTTYPDEIVAIGAHYDSVPFSSGVYDNGAGSVTIMEVLHHFAKNPPARTVRFIWFGAEEIGMLGSQAYLAQHAEELDKHIFMMNADVGAIALGQDYISVTGEKDLQTYVEYAAKEKGIQVRTVLDAMPSDCTPFSYKGIPSMNFGRGAVPGAEYMHTRYDCIAFQSGKVLEETANFMTLFADRMVNAVQFPVSRTIPEDIMKKCEKMVAQFQKPQREE